MNLQIAFSGYSTAAIASGILTVLLVSVWWQRVRGSMLVVACLATALWAGALAWISSQPAILPSQVFLIEIAHDFVWLLFLSTSLGGAVAERSNWIVRRGGVVLAGSLFIAGLVMPQAAGQLLVMGSIATSLFALVGIEQLYRNARPSQQNGLKFLCLGLAGIFAYDLFLYSNAVADGQISAVFWGARGFVVALCMPMIAVAVRRIPSWSRGIFASRQIVFYTTTLFAAGIYLTLAGIVGYYVQRLGKDWGDVLQPVFFSAAVLGFFALIMSEQFRARIRVWLTKHFFERKYDYRAEWLGLIHTLTDSHEGMPLNKRAIQSLAQILDVPAGQLWQKDDDGDAFVPTASWNMLLAGNEYAPDSSLVRFLSANAWVVDVAELASSPRKYAPLEIDDVPEPDGAAGYVVPLMHEEELFGFISLARSRTQRTLNFEDHDLLKTAGQQIASYLAQEKATESLAESRQFEAYNKFAAFVMHDLKNAIAQQSLVVENAEKHKRNPEFVDDAMETIKSSVERLRRVLAHLRQGATELRAENVDITRVLLNVESQCADREPAPIAKVPGEAVVVRANRERLQTAITHAVRNAQDACDQDGEVRLSLEVSEDGCRIMVSDTGCGMDPDFIRDRLFRPFDSTKGAEGMGIGAYQVRETLRASGGDVEVKSVSGEGTSLIMFLPKPAEGRA